MFSMRVIFAATVTLLLCCALARGQQERSHVERFSSPEKKAERTEAEATAKLARTPDDAETLNERALARMRLGRYAEAHDDLRRALALQPQSAEYWANLGYALWRLGKLAEAIEAERAALKLDEKNFVANYQLGRFLLRTGDVKLLPEAVKYLRRALELDPRQYEVRFELIAAYRLLGDTAQALAQLDVLLDARPSDPRVIYVNALLAADRGDLAEAVKGFRTALRQDPTLDGVRLDLGLAYLKMQRWQEAVEVFDELARRQADSVEAAYFHALALYNAGRIDDAEREARRALRLNAGAAPAHTLLGIILASRGGAEREALESLTQAVALDPASFDANLYLGRVQYMMRNYTEAARSLRAAVRLNPRHAEAHFLLGTVLEALGDAEAAMREYQEIVQREPQSIYGQLGLGALLVKQGKIEDAIAALRRATALEPKNFEAQWALGRALLLANRPAEALEPLRSAVALAPDRTDARYQLGLALKRLGRDKEAAREFATVERLNAEFRAGAAPKP